jgi:hypothetical protein
VGGAVVEQVEGLGLELALALELELVQEQARDLAVVMVADIELENNPSQFESV